MVPEDYTGMLKEFTPLEILLFAAMVGAGLASIIIPAIYYYNNYFF